MRRLLLLLLVSLLLGGCESISSLFSGKDNSIPPTELEDITPVVSLRPLWDKKVGVGTDDAMVNLNPAFSVSDIYTVDREGQVTSLNKSSGQINWQMELDIIVTSGLGFGNDMLFLGNDIGELIVLDAENGQLKWKKELSSVILSAPLTVADIVIARTGDGKLYGLNVENGEQLWVYDRGVPVLTLRGNSAPLLGGDQLVFAGFDSGKVTALGVEHGRLLWETSASTASGRSDLERLVDIDGDMLLIGRVLYVVTYQGRAVALDAIAGEVLWAREMSSSTGLGADERHIYVTDSDSNVWALDRQSGESLWKQDKLTYRQVTKPVALDDYVLVADFEGYVHLLTRYEGEFAGRLRVDKDGVSIHPVVDEEVLYIYGNGGKLSALEISY